MTNFVNLTPHAISLFNTNGELLVTIPASGTVARVSSTQTVEDTLNLNGLTIEVVKTSFGEVEGIPEHSEGVVFIVSSLVLNALKGTRNDVVAPDTGATAIRKEGQIIGVTRFQK